MTNSAAAVEKYVEAFEALQGNGAGTSPTWLREFRESAMNCFTDVGFPTIRQEEWRFTSVRPVTETAFVHPGHRMWNGNPGAVDRCSLHVGAGNRLVFVDGTYVDELSRAPALSNGARIGSLRDTLATEPELLRPHLGKHAAYDRNGFAALNSAFLWDGAFVYVPGGAEWAEQLELLFLSSGGAEPNVTHPRNLIILGERARATIVEHFAAIDGGTYFTNAVSEVVVGDGAAIDLYRVQRDSPDAFHIATTHSHQGRDSRFEFHPVVLGAALTRHDIRAVMAGEHGVCMLNGLYLGGGRQHIDHHTVIDHAEPHCESHEYFNGVLDGRARGIFTGRIVVQPGAQKTDSEQTNNNLLLTETARADSQPQLEIYADDVRCTHGATLGPLDQSAMFYLMSRGLDARVARQILTYGFGAEILGRMGSGAVRQVLDRVVRGRLSEALGRGPGS